MADKTVSVTLRAKVDSYIAAMRQAGSASGAMANETKANLSRLGSQMTSVGKAATVGLTVPIVAAGGVAVKAAGDFNQSFTKMTTLAGVAAGEIDGLKGSVMGLAGQTGRAPTELAEALYFLRSSGLEGAEAMEALESSAQASAAGMGSTVAVADAVSSAMNAYASSGRDAAEATDVLVATARAGKAEPAELASALGRVLPVAAELGVTFQDVGGAVAAFSQTGNDASGSVTLLSNVLLKLLKPSQQGAEMLAQVGLSMEDIRASIADRGLLSTLQMLSDKLGATNLPKFFEDQQAVVGVLSLLGENAEGVAATFDEVANSQGSLGDAFQAWTEGPGAGIAQAWGEIQVAVIQAGEKILPIVADVMGVLGDLAGVFSDLPGPVQAGILALGGLAAIAGPMLIAAGMIVKSLDSIALAVARLHAVQLPGWLGMAGKALPLAAASLASWQMGEAAQQNRQGVGSDANYGSNPLSRFGNRLIGRELPTARLAPNFGHQPSGMLADMMASQPMNLNSLAERFPNESLTAQRDALRQAGEAAVIYEGQVVKGAEAAELLTLWSTRLTSEQDHYARETRKAMEIADEQYAAFERGQEAAQKYGDTLASTDWGEAGFTAAQSAMSQFNEEFFALPNMAMATEAAFDNLGTSIAENGYNFDLATEKGRANQMALQDVAATLEGQFVVAYDNANGSLDTFMASADAIGSGVMQTLQSELGLSAEQAAELATKLGLTAQDYQARFELAGTEEARVRLGLLSGTIDLLQADVQREVAMRIATGDFQGALDLVQANIQATPTSHNTNFTARDGVSGVVSQIQRAMAGLRDKTVTITTNQYTRAISQSVAQRLARGGMAGPQGALAGEAGPELLEIGGQQMVISKATFVPPGTFVTPFSSGSGQSSSATPGSTLVWQQNAPIYGVDDLRRTLNDAFRERDRRHAAGVR
jgi:TP901 family phage tail tape measure protein